MNLSQDFIFKKKSGPEFVMSSDAGYEVERVHFSLDVDLDGKICDIFPNESEFASSLTYQRKHCAMISTHTFLRPLFLRKIKKKE